MKATRILTLCLVVAQVIGNQTIASAEKAAAPKVESRAGSTARGESRNGQEPKPSKAKNRSPLEFKGRIVARAGFARQTTTAAIPDQVNALDLAVHQARAGLRYRSPIDGLSANLEVDVASGKLSLKDAWIQARGEHLAGRAGYFKMPGPAMTMESSWALPTAHRGFMHDILVNRLEIAGRRPGAMFGVRDRGSLRPELTVGAFQGSYLSSVADRGTRLGRDTDLLYSQDLPATVASPAEFPAQNVVARGSIEVLGAKLGAFYEHRIGTPELLVQGGYYWTVGADVTVDQVLGRGGLRIWLDGIAGSSWFQHTNRTGDADTPTFVSGRALVAYRRGGIRRGEFYVESYALVGAVDPDLAVVSDLAWETAVGLNVGAWQRARVTLQGEVNQILHNFPLDYTLLEAPERRALILQAGMAF